MKRFYTFRRDAYLTIEAENLTQAWEIVDHSNDDAWEMGDTIECSRSVSICDTSTDIEMSNQWTRF